MLVMRLIVRERSHEEMEEDEDESRDNSEQQSMSVVLHEDKRYYPSALEVYGPDIIAPNRKAKFQIKQQELPETTYSIEFLADMMDASQLIRNIVLFGHLHHGKPTLIDWNYLHELVYIPPRCSGSYAMTESRIGI
ncbi:hypothetical protein PV328_004172 [Microctonus aethiopoides]|uniref:116kDa U5 small nuclear ribonucleoprotein component N-terminal domain-containing protein n=1 Tax=Microctonus aethiopoides TaxID=144406 RepID=A0AA39KLF2_9HYME|nr:hypothetical protein PV328_004172 [Microctonus aethiopoides]